MISYKIFDSVKNFFGSTNKQQESTGDIKQIEVDWNGTATAASSGITNTSGYAAAATTHYWNPMGGGGCGATTSISTLNPFNYTVVDVDALEKRKTEIVKKRVIKYYMEKLTPEVRDSITKRILEIKCCSDMDSFIDEDEEYKTVSTEISNGRHHNMSISGGYYTTNNLNWSINNSYFNCSALCPENFRSIFEKVCRSDTIDILIRNFLKNNISEDDLLKMHGDVTITEILTENDNA